MSLEHTLRTTVARAFGEISWEENPLITVGLSQAILTLRVTDAQLFNIVRGYLRRLAASVHPDITKATGNEPPEIVEERVRIMKAFDLLDDEKTFYKALEEFKILSSADRSELARLRSSLAATRSLLESATKDLDQINLQREAFRREQQEFELKKTDSERQFRELRQKLGMAATEKGMWQTRFEAKLRTNRRLLQILEWQRMYLFSQAPHWFNELVPGRVQTVIPADAHRVTVLTFYFTEPRTKIITVPFQELSEIARKRYDEAIQKLIELGRKNMPNVMPGFFVQKMTILHGKIGRAERLLGSFPIEEVAKTTYKRVERMPYRFVAPRVVPYLLPGNILVGVLPPRHKAQIASQSELYDALRRRSFSRSAYLGRLTTGRVLLEIE